MGIDISKLKKTDVLIALYHNARPQGMGFLHYNDRGMRQDEAESLLENQTYFDYLQGRVMKINLSGDELDPRLYDRDNGNGAAQRAIEQISK